MKAYSLSKILFVTVMMLGAVSVRAAWLATDTTLNAGDTTYDNQDIVVSNCTLTVNGPHGFNSLQVLGGGVVTHSPATTNQIYALQLTIANSLIIDKSSKIDVTGMGYLPGWTLGHTINGGATGRAGGSYGGFGSYGSGGQLNQVYGDFRNPNELGSGGGNANPGGSGGGLIRLVANSIVLEGAIKADGGNGWSSGNEAGGSGGGIYLKVGSLTGAGSISANGGLGYWDGGSGSGGRIAIYCDTANGLDAKKINALGRNGPHGASAVGTIYIQQNNQRGLLRIVSNDAAIGLYTSLGIATNTIFDLGTEDLLISGPGVIVRPDHQMAIKVYNLVLEKGAVLTTWPTTTNQEYSLQIEARTVQIDKDSKIDVTGMGYLPGWTLGSTTTSGGATGRAGGSYGGFGSYGSGGGLNPVYGDFRNPNELGSGGGNANLGGSGGGLIRLIADSMVLDGAIKANGGDGWSSGNEAAGSGGGINIQVGSLTGAGLISANGGYGNWTGGSGGGGRIAIYYATNGVPTTNIITLGRSGPGGPSAVGTVYTKQDNQPGVLRIDNFGSASGVWTPLGVNTNQTLDLSQDHLVLSGTNVVVKPEHQMALKVKQLTLEKGAVLTHLPTTTNINYSLDIEVETMAIDSSAKIDVTGLGYLPGRTTGNSTLGGAASRAGGSYGGLGCLGNGGVANRAYGDFRNPVEPGSGGGNANLGGSGGGFLRIKANELLVNGAIKADGGNGWDSGHEAAGSGGGIYIKAGSLTGTGSISANGGVGNWTGGSGGGGRIAIYYATNNLPTTNITALGRNGSGGSSAVGTIYAKQDNQPGLLRIDNFGSASGVWTPLGISADQTLDLSLEHLIISGTNVVVKPEHQMALKVKQLTLGKGAVLTHLPTTTNTSYSLDIDASNLVIDSSSKIDVSGLGYLPGRTTGNSTVGGATGRAGGSYGGLGSLGTGGVANRVYGDFRNPIDPGSGGGDVNPAGSGGGFLRIKADTLVLDGALKANGGDGWDSGHETSGSGGGIYLKVGSLTGAGLISANGGVGNWTGGSGGGGRIAIYYATNGVPTTNIITLGRSGPGGPSAVGTVYTKQDNQPGVLRIDNFGSPAGVWTPLGINADQTWDLSQDHLVLSGTNLVVKPEHQMAIKIKHLTLEKGAVLTHQPTTDTTTYSLDIDAGTLIIDGSSKIDVTALGYLPGRTTGNSQVGGATGRAGGSYGGWGRVGSDGAANRVYGNYRNPIEPGSGGGNANLGGAGGGLVRIKANELVLDGVLKADGGDGWSSGNEAAGSGGGIYLKVGSLTGAGSISANGGLGYWNGGSGSGGRIAIYCDTANGIDGEKISALGRNGPHGPSAVGTIYTKLTSGLGLLRIDNNGTPAGVWTPLGLSTDTIFDMGEDHLLISGTNVVAKPEHQMIIKSPRITLNRGAVLTHLPTTITETYSLELAVDELIIDEFSSINVTALGYLPGRTVGNTTIGGASGRAGGSYGGLGHAGNDGTPNALYGDYRNVDEPGSGGGAVNPGGSGGGLVRIFAQSISLDGSVQANGGNGWSSGNEAAGSGGGVLLNSGRLAGKGSIMANGGFGYWNGGNGGGGRIAIYTWLTNGLPATNVTAQGGSGGTGPGQDGSVLIGSSPFFGWQDQASILHGSAKIAWYAFGVDPATIYTEITAFCAGNSYPIAAGMKPIDSTGWDTTTVPDGAYELRAIFRNASAQVVGDISRAVLVNNSAVWHTGTVTGQEVWAPGTIHIVEGSLTIATNAQVTIQPGTVVKFAPEARMTVKTGGTLIASGTEGAKVAFTALADDTLGGDDNMDGDRSRPQPGAWNGINAESGAVFTFNDQTVFRYMSIVHSGVLAADETWRGTYLHTISADLTVPAGKTLNIEPGAVVKIAEGQSILVSAGGFLTANGTVAQPIIFTSIRDDSIAGDANGDGDKTVPSAGDWKWIYLNGGNGGFNHCWLYYGGGPAADGWGPPGGPGKATIKTDGAATLSFSNSMIRDSFYDGLLCWGGPVTVVNSVFKGIDRAICAHPGSSVQVVNCTLDDNRVGLLIHGGSLDVANTIVANSFTAGILHDYSADALTVHHTDLWPDNASGTANWQVGANGNISADPKFKNPTNENYRLNFGSTCLDAADGVAAPATDFMGAPRYTDPRSPHTGIVSTNGEYADMGAFEFVEDADSPIDLAAIQAEGPVAVTAGESVTVRWQIANVGVAAVSGTWHDEIALVADLPQRGVNRIVVNEVLTSATLGPGESKSFEAGVRVPGGTEGAWRWQVTANSKGEVFEGRNWRNNASPLAAVTVLSVPAIAPGMAVSSRFAGARQASWYKFTQPAGVDMFVTLDAATTNGHCRLYAGFGSMPTEPSFDQRNTEWNAADARMGVAAPTTEQTVYLLVMPETLPDDATAFTLSVDRSTFGLATVDLARAGNAGNVTVPIRGSGFNTNLVVLLQPVGGGAAILAQRVLLQDSANALATFPLAGKPVGVCHVLGVQQGLTATLSNAFTIITGLGGRFQAKLVMPKAVRVGRPFAATVEFGNDGDGDVPIPLLAVQNQANYPVWFGGLTATGTATVLQFPALAPESSGGGVLRPGEQGRITFYSKLLAGGFAPYTVSWINGDSTEPEDWNAIRAAVRPDNPPSLWDSAWALLASEAGPRVGDYIAALSRAAEEVRGYGLDYRTPDVLLWFMMEKAMQRYPGASLAGRVYDGDLEHPLAHAVLQLTGPTGQLFTAFTGYDGAFAFRDVVPGVYALSVPGHLLTPATQVTIPSTERRDVIVSRGAQIAGRIVTAADGSPVSGAMINVVDSISNSVYTATSDADGRYEVNGLSSSSYRVVCSSTEYLDAQWSLAVTSAQIYAVSFSLSTGSSLSGRVLAPDGGGVKALVQAFDTASGVSKSATSATNGQFSIAGLPAATYHLVAKATNYGAGTVNGVVLAAGQNISNLTVVLTPPATLTGRVYSSISGLPIAGATISVVGQATAGTPSLSDAQGHYVLQGLTPGDQWIWASATNFDRTATPVTLSGGRTSSVDIALAPLGAVGGFLKTASGTPLADMTVSLTTTNGNPTSMKTDLNGHFVFTGLAYGSYEVAVGDVLGMNVGRQSFVLSAASNIVNTTIPLTGTELQGRVLNAGGVAPASNAVVSLMRQGQPLAETVTDADGGYRFLVFDSEPVEVAAMGAAVGFQRLTGVVMTGGVVSNLNLVGGHANLTVTVRGNASPIPQATVSLRPATDYPSSFLFLRPSDTNGAVGFSNLAYGQYVVDIRAEGWGSRTAPITLSADALATNIDLTAGGVLEGYVRNASGAAVPSAQVSVGGTGSEQVAGSGITDTEGYYRISTLPAGEYRLMVSAGRQFAATQQSVTVNNVTIPLQVDLVLGTNGALARGWARNMSGQSVVGAQIALRTSGGITLQNGSVQADGTYRLGPVVPGAYQLVATTIGASVTVSNINLTAEGEQTVNLTVPNASAVALPTTGSLPSSGFATALATADDKITLKALGILDGHIFGEWYVTEPTRVNGDTEEWRTKFYYYPAKNANCKAYLDAKTEAAHSLWWMNYEYGAWEQAYGALSSAERNGMGLLAAHTAKVAAKIYLLIQTWPLAQAKLGMAIGADLNHLEQVIANLVSRLASIGEDWISKLRSGEKPGLNEVAKFLFDSKAVVVDLIAQKALLGPISGIWDIINEINDENADLEAAFNDTSNMQRTCINAQSQYYSWLKIHQANLAKVLAASQQDCPDCKDKCTGCPPPAPRPGEEFIPQPPPPRNPCCGVVGPCPPPCQHCPNGGSNGSGTTGSGSIDPNDKQTTGFGKGSMIQAGARVTFLIRFENKTNATAAAQQVTVTDPLSPDFDYSTVELLDLGFNNVDVIVPRGLSQFETNGIRVATDPNPVRVVAGLNPDTGVLSWLIESVSEITGGLPEDPLAGFLPPNDAQHRGEGYVSYSVCVRTNVANGASITNQARIVFDVNPPIDTPMVTNQVDLLAPLSSVQPLPGISATTFEVKWSGADEEQGSGLASFDIYVATDNRAFVQWLTGVTNTSASFTGQPGSTYRFFSIARDNVGNVEALPPSADATTTIKAQSSSASLEIRYLPPSSVQISWPTSMVQYVLQAIPAFNAAQNWRSVTDLPSVVGDQFVLTLGALEATHYYRLYALPQLSIQQTNGLLMLSWPKSATDFRLEVREDLLPATQWQPVSDVPLTDNNRNVLIVTPVTPSRYYRLVSP